MGNVLSNFSEIFSGIPLEGAIGLAAIAVAGIVWTVLSRQEEARQQRETLSQVDGYDVAAAAQAGVLDHDDLQGSFMDRFGSQVFSGAGDFGRRFTPAGYVDKVRKKFIMAGQDSTAQVDRFLAMRVMAICAIPFIIGFFFFWNPLGFEGGTRLMIVGFLIMALVLGPDAKLSRAVEDLSLIHI